MIDDPTVPGYHPPPLRSEMVFQYAPGSDPGYGDEVTLVSAALASDEAVKSLRWVETKEFRDPQLRNVAQAILDLAEEGEPHDAEAVTTLLRTRHQLPPQWDPEMPIRDVDPRGYALGAWESTAMPPEYAARCAVEIRQRYALHYVRSIAVAAIDQIDRVEGMSATEWEGIEMGPARLAYQMSARSERIPPPLEIPTSSLGPYPEGSNLGLPEHPNLTLGAKLAMQESARHGMTRAR